MRALLTLSILFSIAADAEEYTLSVDSLLQEGVPQGSVEKHTWDTSSIYPGTTTDYWVYVPAQYTKEKPACVMVFQDGQAYLSTEGPLRAPTVFDNLIHKEEMPVTIGIFVSSGMRERPGDQREVRYVTIGDTYARFLLEEIIPEVEKDYNLVDDALGRAIAGASDGGLVSFTVAWHRPDEFSKVISHMAATLVIRGYVADPDTQT
jgi:enterochelin esterase-like enzyme